MWFKTRVIIFRYLSYFSIYPAIPVLFWEFKKKLTWDGYFIFKRLIMIGLALFLMLAINTCLRTLKPKRNYFLLCPIYKQFVERGTEETCRYKQPCHLQNRYFFLTWIKLI